MAIARENGDYSRGLNTYMGHQLFTPCISYRLLFIQDAEVEKQCPHVNLKGLGQPYVNVTNLLTGIDEVMDPKTLKIEQKKVVVVGTENGVKVCDKQDELLDAVKAKITDIDFNEFFEKDRKEPRIGYRHNSYRAKLRQLKASLKEIQDKQES